jgi:hypothetical protein
LLREDETNAITGFPGAIHVPFFKQLFSGNDKSSQQQDIVMLLTPHIIRTAEVTPDDLKGIYIGSQQNLGVGGPPPLIAAPPDVTPAPVTPGGTIQGPGGVQLAVPPGSSPVPGTVPVPAAPPPGASAQLAPAPQPPPAVAPAFNPPVQTPQALPQATPVNPAAAQAAAASAAANGPPSARVGSTQVIVSPPEGVPFRVGGGPYNVPISVVNASRLSTITLSVTYDPNVLRVRTVQEGSFMRLGGANATFTNNLGNGRVDITITRSADATGASGTGVLGALIFDGVAPGTTTITVAGAATGPGGTPMGLSFRAATVTVQR